MSGPVPQRVFRRLPASLLARDARGGHRVSSQAPKRAGYRSFVGARMMAMQAVPRRQGLHTRPPLVQAVGSAHCPGEPEDVAQQQALVHAELNVHWVPLPCFWKQKPLVQN